MRTMLKYTIYGLLLSASYFMFSAPAFSQDTQSESLRLPEVVITGTDQSKIQRTLPNVTLQAPLPVVTDSSRDRSDAVVREGNVLSLTQPEQAEQRYRQALRIDPTNSRAYLRLGDVTRILGRTRAAIDAYHSALAHSPDLLEAHYYLGILYENTPGETAQAKEHYHSYLQLGGPDSRVRIWLRNLEN